MNKIIYKGSEVINLKKVPGSRADYTLKNTLDYVAGLLDHNYHTPDDVTFEFTMVATLSNVGNSNIIVRCVFLPRRVNKTKGSIQIGAKKASLNIDLHYNTDVEMTENLYIDISKILSHIGKSALYNTTKHEIHAVRKLSTESKLSKKFIENKIFKPL